MKTDERRRTASRFKAALKERKLTIGSWLSFGYPPIAEMMAQAGFEWLVIDMEHTAISFEKVEQLMQAMLAYGCEPVVRVGANDPLLIKRSLDIGAHGIIVPMVNSVDDARRAVSATHYPPRGTRGTGLYRAQGYGSDFEAYRGWAEENISLIVQIEHIDGVSNLDAILAEPGVDGFIVGPYDLSASLGFPGKFDNPAVEEALRRVSKTVRATRTSAGFHIVHADPVQLKEKVDSGYRMIAYGDDMIFLGERLQEVRRTISDIHS